MIEDDFVKDETWFDAHEGGGGNLTKNYKGPRPINFTPLTLHPSPYTLHPAPYTLHPPSCNKGGGGNFSKECKVNLNPVSLGFRVQVSGGTVTLKA